MTSHRDYQTITIHALPNISRSKSNETMKRGQLIGYILVKLCKCFLEWPWSTS